MFKFKKKKIFETWFVREEINFKTTEYFEKDFQKKSVYKIVFKLNLNCGDRIILASSLFLGGVAQFG